MRQKPFLHYDDLCIIFGKDRATGEAAESPADAVEELEREESQNLDLDDIDLFEKCDDGDAELPPLGSQPTTPGSSSSTQQQQGFKKKRVRSNDGLMESLAKGFMTFTEAYKEGINEMRKMAYSFEVQAGIDEKRAKLTEELQKIDGLTSRELFKAGRVIGKEPHLIEMFFGLSPELRRDFIREEIGAEEECYHPTFHFSD